MQNPFQPGADTQAAMNDPLAFIKKLWGDMQLPGMVTPTISVDELDKQIKDLKTVESWLTVNMNMLRGTIQALEVQRATITALKAMGESFAQTAATASTASHKASTQNHDQWPMHQSSETLSEAQADAENQMEDETEQDLPPDADNATASSQEVGGDSAKVDTTAAYSNPAAWWNVLQDQFKQALGNALKDDEDVKPTSGNKATTKKSTTPSSRKAPVKNTSKSTKAVAKSQAKSVKPISKPKTTTTSKSTRGAKKL